MRVSDLKFTEEMKENVWAGHNVQTPTDASRVIANKRHAENFIAKFGDVEIEFDVQYKQWVVPAFAEQRKRYCNAKQAHCEQFGSN